MSYAYYNELDPYAAQWIRNLIRTRLVAPGFVDERSIEDVHPDDLKGFTQHHFFAGVGVWSYALRLAGWSDGRRVWTGSCPCQPLSAAGKGKGFADERHLWPAWYWLIEQCRPPVVFGEQVASKLADEWVDLVQADVEALGYAFGCAPFPAAGIGAPHIRDRNYWLARRLGHADDEGPQGHPRHDGAARGQGPERPVAASGVSGGLAHTDGRDASAEQQQRGGQHRQQQQADGSAGGLADDRSGGREVAVLNNEGSGATLRQRQADEPGSDRAPDRSSPLDGFWRDADWLYCRDGRWRPVEPGTQPLAHGVTRRVGRSGTDWRTPAGPEGFAHRGNRLRGYGNAIVAEQAATFIRIALDYRP